MIISDEQVRKALEYIHETGENSASSSELPPDVTPELVERVRSQIASLPDMRADRIEEARKMLDEGGVGSDEVAGKLIGRIISDSIR